MPFSTPLHFMNTRRLELFTDTLMILFCVLFPHVARLPMFAYPAVVLLAVWGYLRWKHQTFADIGFRWKDLHFKAVFVGAGIGVLWTALVIFVLGPGLLKLTGLPPADLHDFYFIRDDRAKFIQLLLIACVWVIPYEEIIFSEVYAVYHTQVDAADNGGPGDQHPVRLLSLAGRCLRRHHDLFGCAAECVAAEAL